jgi:signal transduction histidine kinase
VENHDVSQETLLSKVQLKTRQLSDVIAHHEHVNIQQKEEIQRMVSDISHQLNTPMANILMYNDTILNHALPKDKERECIAVIQSQVLKMEFLIKSLIKMSRLENNVIALNKTRIRADEVISEALSGISGKAAAKGISLEMEDVDPDTILFCDVKWTNEALSNILDNAVKYTPQGGKIKIAAQRLERYTKISIADTGIGIEEENINHIFKRFFREHKIYQKEGIGLGLYLTRQIITQQGGYIKVSSKPREGTTFSLYFPL